LNQTDNSRSGDFRTHSGASDNIVSSLLVNIEVQVNATYEELCRRYLVFGLSLEAECCLLVQNVEMYCGKNIRGSKANVTETKRYKKVPFRISPPAKGKSRSVSTATGGRKL
jgi:hypothetical protein